MKEDSRDNDLAAEPGAPAEKVEVDESWLKRFPEALHPLARSSGKELFEFAWQVGMVKELLGSLARRFDQQASFGRNSLKLVETLSKVVNAMAVSRMVAAGWTGEQLNTLDADIQRIVALAGEGAGKIIVPTKH